MRYQCPHCAYFITLPPPQCPTCGRKIDGSHTPLFVERQEELKSLWTICDEVQAKGEVQRVAIEGLPKVGVSSLLQSLRQSKVQSFAPLDFIVAHPFSDRSTIKDSLPSSNDYFDERVHRNSGELFRRIVQSLFSLDLNDSPATHAKRINRMSKSWDLNDHFIKCISVILDLNLSSELSVDQEWWGDSTQNAEGHDVAERDPSKDDHSSLPNRLAQAERPQFADDHSSADQGRTAKTGWLAEAMPITEEIDALTLSWPSTPKKETQSHPASPDGSSSTSESVTLKSSSQEALGDDVWGEDSASPTIRQIDEINSVGEVIELNQNEGWVYEWVSGDAEAIEAMIKKSDTPLFQFSDFNGSKEETPSSPPLSIDSALQNLFSATPAEIGDILDTRGPISIRQEGHDIQSMGDLIPPPLPSLAESLVTPEYKENGSDLLDPIHTEINELFYGSSPLHEEEDSLLEAESLTPHKEGFESFESSQIRPTPRRQVPDADVQPSVLGDALAVSLAELIMLRAQERAQVVLLLDLQHLPKADIELLKVFVNALKRGAVFCVMERPPVWDYPHYSLIIPPFDFEKTCTLIKTWRPDLTSPLAAAERLLRLSKGSPYLILKTLYDSQKDAGVELQSLQRAAHKQGVGIHHSEYTDLLLFICIAGPTASLGQVKVIARSLDLSPWTQLSAQDQVWDRYLEEALSRKEIIETQHRRFRNEKSYRLVDQAQRKEFMKQWQDRFSSDERKVTHRLLAEWMTRQLVDSEAETQVALTVVEHWVEGDAPSEAAKVTLLVAQQLLLRGNSELTRSALQQAFDLMGPYGPWDLWREAHFLFAKLSAEAGDIQAAETSHHRVMKRAWQIDDQATLIHQGEALIELYEDRGFQHQAESVSQWLSQLPFTNGADSLDHLQIKGSALGMIQHSDRSWGRPNTSFAHAPKEVIASKAPPPRILSPLQGGAPLKGQPIVMNDVKDLEVPPSPVLTVLKRLHSQGFEAWIVGGSVRDRLLGRAVHDWDITTSALPEEVSESFDKVILTGVEHGTVTVMIEGLSIEVTTYRVDGEYRDGRHPEMVSFTRSLREDLARRDFTINAMAWDPLRHILEDPFEGISDLKRGCIRTVGSPLKRFQEDALRTLRAIRFAAVLGFQIDPETEEGVAKSIDMLIKVSMERVRVELFKMLLSEGGAWGMTTLRRLGYLSEILPEIEELSASEWPQLERALNRSPLQLIPRLAVLFHSVPNAMNVASKALKRLKCSNKECRDVTHLLQFKNISPSTPRTDAQIRTLVAHIQLPFLEPYWSYRQSWAMNGHLDEWVALWSRLKALRVHESPQSARDLAIRGREICHILNIPPSKLVGQILQELLSYVWRYPEHNTSEALIAHLPKIAHALGIQREAPQGPIKASLEDYYSSISAHSSVDQTPSAHPEEDEIYKAETTPPESSSQEAEGSSE